MKEIILKEDIKIPNTDLVLEAGDKIKIQEAVKLIIKIV